MPQNPFPATVLPIKWPTFRVKDAGRAAYNNTTTLWALFGGTQRVKLRKVKIIARAGAASVADIGIVKRTVPSAASQLIAGGTSIALNPYFDSAGAAPTAGAYAITAAPTFGALEQGIDSGMLFLNAGSVFTTNGLVFDFSEETNVDPTKPPTLESPNEMLEINLGTYVAAAGDVFDFSMEWTEQSTLT